MIWYTVAYESVLGSIHVTPGHVPDRYGKKVPISGASARLAWDEMELPARRVEEG